MHLVPTEDEVLELLRRTGGLRDGHLGGLEGWPPVQTGMCLPGGPLSSFLDPTYPESRCSGAKYEGFDFRP